MPDLALPFTCQCQPCSGNFGSGSSGCAATAKRNIFTELNHQISEFLMRDKNFVTVVGHEILVLWVNLNPHITMYAQALMIIQGCRDLYFSFVTKGDITDIKSTVILPSCLYQVL